MKVKSQEERFASQLRGMAAKAELDIAKPLLAARRERLIAQAINDFEAGKLDGNRAMLFIAALVENRHLLDDLEFTERQGSRDGKKLQEI